MVLRNRENLVTQVLDSLQYVGEIVGGCGKTAQRVLHGREAVGGRAGHIAGSCVHAS